MSENLAKLSKELRIPDQQEPTAERATRSTSNSNLSNFADGDEDDQPKRRRSSTISGAQDVHREMSADQDAKNGGKQDTKRDQKRDSKVDQNRKQQLHSASFTCTGNRELAVSSMRNKSESLPPKSPLFKIFNQISQNKSANNSDENLGNSSSSSSSNLRASNSNISNLSPKSNDEKEHFAFDKTEPATPSSILKQPKTANKPTTKQRSLEKTIEFASSVTSISDSNQQQEINIRDSDEEKDVLYDENGEPYGVQADDADVEENSTVSWRKQIFSNIHSSTRRLELSSEPKGATKSVTFDSSGDLFKTGTRKRTREELRELWRKAINQQIVLIKMEKENILLQGNNRLINWLIFG